MPTQNIVPEDVITEAIPLRDQVADIVRRMILRGEFKADEQISERYISQLLNVSTTPVKEAFRSLQTEGLLYVRPRRGSYVSRLSADFMLQLVFMRGSLEGIASYFAAMYATEDEIEQMESVLEEAGKLVHSIENAPQLSKLNRRFHSILRKASRNDYLVKLITNMGSIDKTIREMSLTIEEEEPARTHKEHLDMLDAVKRRDSEGIERHMIHHIRRVAHLVLDREIKTSAKELAEI